MTENVIFYYRFLTQHPARDQGRAGGQLGGIENQPQDIWPCCLQGEALGRGGRRTQLCSLAWQVWTGGGQGSEWKVFLRVNLCQIQLTRQHGAVSAGQQCAG